MKRFTVACHRKGTGHILMGEKTTKQSSLSYTNSEQEFNSVSGKNLPRQNIPAPGI